MAWTPKQLTLAFIMFVTGSINTLSAKLADRTVAQGRDGYPVHPFDHPFLQAVGMFIGEAMCLLAFLGLYSYKKSRSAGQEVSDLGNLKFNPLIFFPPAMCDMCATSLMYLGLNLTFASSFQMLRGAVMIFTALLSVAFLRRTINAHMWIGMMLTLAGLLTVGASDVLFGGEQVHDVNGIISGDLIILAAQVITATQMVYEEKFVLKHNVHPLLAVGWEGIFGMTVLGLLNIPFNYIYVGRFGKNPQNTLEDPIDALIQISNSSIIALALFGMITSIAFFNWSGISVTKELSATTRMVLDSLRTVAIWVVSLIASWQQFYWLQVVGFLVLIAGTAIYNNLHEPIMKKFGGDHDQADQRRLVRPVSDDL